MEGVLTIYPISIEIDIKRSPNIEQEGERISSFQTLRD